MKEVKLNKKSSCCNADIIFGAPSDNEEGYLKCSKCGRIAKTEEEMDTLLSKAKK